MVASGCRLVRLGRVGAYDRLHVWSYRCALVGSREATLRGRGQEELSGGWLDRSVRLHNFPRVDPSGGLSISVVCHELLSAAPPGLAGCPSYPRLTPLRQAQGRLWAVIFRRSSALVSSSPRITLGHLSQMALVRNTRSLGFARDDRVGEGVTFGDVFAWSVVGVDSSALGGRGLGPASRLELSRPSGWLA
jgi:hypothetical protein